jgi:hypothetical protein
MVAACQGPRLFSTIAGVGPKLIATLDFANSLHMAAYNNAIRLF